MLSKLRHSERSEESYSVGILRRFAPQNDKLEFISQNNFTVGIHRFNLDAYVRPYRKNAKESNKRLTITEHRAPITENDNRKIPRIMAWGLEKMGIYATLYL